jgi:Tfp pilus assembly PilM family ATPase
MKRAGIFLSSHAVCASIIQVNSAATYLAESIYMPKSNGSNMTDLLYQIKSSCSLKKMPIMLGITLDDCICKTIKLDATLKAGQIKKYLMARAKDLFGCRHEQLMFSFEKLATSCVAEQSSYRCIAAKRDYIWQIIQACQTLKLKFQSLEIGEHVWSRILPVQQKNIVGVLMINACQAKLVVYDFISGNKFIRSERFSPAESVANILIVINRLLHFYRCQQMDSPIKHLFFVKSDAIKFNVISSLQKQTKLPIEHLSPANLRLTIDPNIPAQATRHWPVVLTSTALALRGKA